MGEQVHFPWGFTFTPAMEFYSDEVKSTYVPGLIYQINPGNVLLAKLVSQWLREGKVHETLPGAGLSGS